MRSLAILALALGVIAGVSSPCAAQSETAGSQPHSVSVAKQAAPERLAPPQAERGGRRTDAGSAARTASCRSPRDRARASLRHHSAAHDASHDNDADRATGRTRAASRFLLGREAARLGHQLSQTSEPIARARRRSRHARLRSVRRRGQGVVLHRFHRRRARHQSKGRPQSHPAGCSRCPTRSRR